MRLTIIALASAFAPSSTCALAHTVRHGSHARTYPIYRNAAPSVVLHPNYGNLNGNPDGPTTLNGPAIPSSEVRRPVPAATTKRKPCSAMTPYLIAAREGIIWWVTLTLTPVEVVFDWLEDEIERRPVSP
jgi:hypothetical protein